VELREKNQRARPLTPAFPPATPANAGKGPEMEELLNVRISK
jgi:hypothetical protein